MARCASSRASFIRWASPPDMVVAGCPRWMYPSPVRWSEVRVSWILGMFSSSGVASSTVSSRVSAIDRPLNLISRVSRLYRRPLQASHWVVMSGRKCMWMRVSPSPWQDSHRPPFVLKENLPGL